MRIYTNNYNNKTNFGWNIRTHLAITEEALKDNPFLSRVEKRLVARYSQLPDLIKEELQDMSSAHFYDVLHEDPSFGTVNDKINNALSRFLSHHKEAMKAKSEGKIEKFFRELGSSAHYLQDASCPPHTEHGNYFHKLYRLPMHLLFERSKKLGASYRLSELKAGFKPERIPVSTLDMLLHNTALYAVQLENHVGYHNISKWKEIQQRCFNRGVNASKAYFDYIFENSNTVKNVDPSIYHF